MEMQNRNKHVNNRWEAIGGEVAGREGGGGGEGRAGQSRNAEDGVEEREHVIWSTIIINRNG